jgi:hypothetical protein
MPRTLEDLEMQQAALTAKVILLASQKQRLKEEYGPVDDVGKTLLATSIKRKLGPTPVRHFHKKDAIIKEELRSQSSTNDHHFPNPKEAQAQLYEDMLRRLESGIAAKECEIKRLMEQINLFSRKLEPVKENLETLDDELLETDVTLSPPLFESIQIEDDVQQSPSESSTTVNNEDRTQRALAQLKNSGFDQFLTDILEKSKELERRKYPDAAMEAFIINLKLNDQRDQIINGSLSVQQFIDNCLKILARENMQKLCEFRGVSGFFKTTIQNLLSWAKSEYNITTNSENRINNMKNALLNFKELSQKNKTGK